MTRPEDGVAAVKPGDFHWVDSRVTHALANGGHDPGDLVEVELK